MHEIVLTENAQSWSNSFGKRAFDIAVSATALTLLSPVFVAIAVGIKLTSRGTVFFKQQRTGKGQTPFTIYKFRTMRDRKSEGPTVTRKNDHRITWLGRLLRITKCDELPQFYNVLKGDMSLVGPRPKLVGHEYGFLELKPGMTGAATLIFAREQELLAHIPEKHIDKFTITVLHRLKSELDRQYAKDCTFSSDIKIMFNTLSLGRSVAVTTLEELEKEYSLTLEDCLQECGMSREDLIVKNVRDPRSR